MFRVSSLVAVSGLLVAVAACQGPYGAQNVCETQARAHCRFLYQCCAAGERLQLAGSPSVHSTEEGCVEEVMKSLCASTSVHAEAEAEGRIEWDQAAAEECMRPLVEAAEQCDAEKLFAGMDDDCEGSPWIEGVVENGDACYTNEECADKEASCSPEEPEDPDTIVVSYKGVCTPPAGEGDACLNEPCRSDLFCDGSNYTCQPKRANGDDCYIDDACESGYCDPAMAQCGNRRANGVGCYGDSQCQSGFCDLENGGVCRPAEGGTPGVDLEYDVCTGPQG